MQQHLANASKKARIEILCTWQKTHKSAISGTRAGDLLQPSREACRLSRGGRLGAQNLPIPEEYTYVAPKLSGAGNKTIGPLPSPSMRLTTWPGRETPRQTSPNGSRETCMRRIFASSALLRPKGVWGSQPTGFVQMTTTSIHKLDRTGAETQWVTLSQYLLSHES